MIFTKYISGDLIEKDEMVVACSTYGEMRGVYRILVGKYEGKRQLEGPGLRREFNNKMGLQEVRCGGMDWIDLSQNRDR